MMLPDGPELSTSQQALRWYARPYELLDECAEAFGDTFTLDLGTHGLYVVFSHPDAIKEIFAADTSSLHAGGGNDVLRPFLGNGSLLLLEETRHLAERRLLLPAFRGSAVAAHRTLIQQIAEEAVARLTPDASVSIQRHMQDVSLDVIMRVVFGLRPTDRAAELVPLLQGFLEDPKFNLALLTRLGQTNPSAAWAAFRDRLERIRALLGDEVHERRQSDRDGGDVASMLLRATYEDGTPVPDDAIRDELLTLLVTGFETTATALAWSLTWLDREPAIRDELVATLKKSDAPWREPLLDAFIAEVLRIHPIIPVVARRVMKPTTIAGVSLPPDVTAAPCIYLAHRRPELWDRPAAFDPRRFLGNRLPPPHVYLPFGGGTRRCLGRALALEEMRVVLGALLPSRTLTLRHPVAATRRSVTIAPSGGTPMHVRNERRASSDGDVDVPRCDAS